MTTFSGMPRGPYPGGDEHLLGELAMRFRRAADDAERGDVAGQYAHAVDRLIHRGGWDATPAPEDQLPEEWMPDSFFEYWGIHRIF